MQHGMRWGLAMAVVAAGIACFCLPACTTQRQTEISVRVGEIEVKVPWGADPIMFKLFHIEEAQKLLRRETDPDRTAKLEREILLWKDALEAERGEIPAPPGAGNPEEREALRRRIDGVIMAVLICIDATHRAIREDLKERPQMARSEAYDRACEADLAWFRNELAYWDDLKRR